MAVNLAIHRAAISDGGGSITLTSANINGITDADTATNAAGIATNNTAIVHYDLGAVYQVADVYMYASIIDGVYWTVDVSLNDQDWTNKVIAVGGSAVGAVINGPWRYVRITCDTMGEAAVYFREFQIWADDSGVKYETGSSDPIGEAKGAGADSTGDDKIIVLATGTPAPADGYIVALKGVRQKIVAIWLDTRFIVVRDRGTYWEVMQYQEATRQISTIDDIFLLEPPFRFKAGDILGLRMEEAQWLGSGYFWVNNPGTGYHWDVVDTDPVAGTHLTKTDYTEEAAKGLGFEVISHADIDTALPSRSGFSGVAVTDATLTGEAGASTDPKVVNAGAAGTNPEVDFYPFVSSLNGGINASVTTITLHDSSEFPQGGVGFSHGGRVRIDDEDIDYIYVSGNDLMECTRGVNGTTPAVHGNWAIVKDIMPYVEVSVDDVNFYGPGDSNLPLSLGATIGAGGKKTFYLRHNMPFNYAINAIINSRIDVLWEVA